MRTTFSTLVRRACGLALGAAFGLALCAPAWALTLPELMATLARVPRGEARFVELRYVARLEAPLRSSGVLSFEAPDRFVRRTVEPRAETMAVEGTQLTLSRNNRSRRVALDAAPEMVAIVEAMRGTLTGNGAVLQQYFQPALTGRLEQWALVLTPLEPRLAQQVRQIRIKGVRDQLGEVEIEMSDGDRSVMTITPVVSVADPASSGVPGAVAR